ncbi:Fic family protein [uncultured Hymenobacter sp.]|uniref:Fic family protein n=1 Tax=uncultured Hymenobacter sp. TaxID=170016 RepID=UPI0035CBC0C3
MTFLPGRPFPLPDLPPALDFDDIRFHRLVAKARTELGELKGYSAALPNPILLLSPAILRESIASSNIENVNTTVEQALQQQLFPEAEQRPADKEVLRYGQAMRWGFEQLPALSLSARLIVGIQQQLLPSGYAGYRTTPNQIINSATGQPVYTPPSAYDINRLLGNWENFVHTPDERIDPLIACAITHYQFEAIHPFGDGNGRTGRILMVLYLAYHELLTLPTLYLSGYINRHRPNYYRLLAQVSAAGDWTSFILFMLEGFHQQARETKQMLVESMGLLQQFRDAVRQSGRKIPPQLIEAVFTQPILTPTQAARTLGVHYSTATKYLNQLTDLNLLEASELGKYHLYSNRQLISLLSRA